jgi:tetratricopeptide (TPR) repeat protein
MKTLFTQFKEAAQAIVLSKREKDRMREHLISYMEYKPIRNTQTASEASYFSMFPFFRVHHYTGALLIAFLVTTSSFGVTFAADDALPGDLLYNVKVNINEEIKSVLQNSPESRIAWNKERAERRLLEASQLAAEGRLDEKNKEKVSKLFAEHTEEMIQEVRAVEVQDPALAAEASGEFEESLDTHEAVLARLIVEQDDEVNNDSRELVEQVRTTAMEIEKIREGAEGKLAEGDTENTTEEGNEVIENNEETETEKIESANMRIRAAQRTQVRSEELYKEALAQVELLDSESNLAIQAETQIAFGKAKMASGTEHFLAHEYSDAHKAYRQAVASFQKVVQLLEVADLFSIEVYSDSVAEGVETETDSGDASEGMTARTETEALRSEAIQEIETARSLLLTQGGHSVGIIDDAHVRIKDAGAYVLRGEIAMVLEDYAGAQTMFERAFEFAQRVVQTLEEESKNEDVTDITPPKPDTPTLETEPHTVSHTFDQVDGVHTYILQINTPTPCHNVSHTVTVAESYPEQISIAIEVLPPQEEGQLCVQAIDTKTVTVTTKASAEAKLTNVTVDDEKMSWVISEVAGVTTDTIDVSEEDPSAIEETQQSAQGNSSQ